MGQETFNLFTRFWVKLTYSTVNGEKKQANFWRKDEEKNKIWIITTKVSQKVWCKKEREREDNCADTP